MNPLYHFTCRHSRKEIGRAGILLPNHHFQGLLSGLLWLTSSCDSTRLQLGLSSEHIDCDRMEYLYVVNAPNNVVPWLESPRRAALLDIEDLEGPGTDPSLWWVTDRPQRARLIRRLG